MKNKHFKIARAGSKHVVGFATLHPNFLRPIVVHSLEHGGEDCTICAAVLALHNDSRLHTVTAEENLYEVYSTPFTGGYFEANH